MTRETTQTLPCQGVATRQVGQLKVPAWIASADDQQLFEPNLTSVLHGQSVEPDTKPLGPTDLPATLQFVKMASKMIGVLTLFGMDFSYELVNPRSTASILVSPAELEPMFEQVRALKLGEYLLTELNNTQERGSKLLELAASGDPRIPVFLAQTLSRTWTDLSWTAVLVVVAEQANLEKDSVRALVKSGLRRAVAEFYQSRNRQWEPAAWSAVRRYASMLAPSEVETLGEFLVSSDEIDTRQVTLQAIQNIFSSHPSIGNDGLDGLRDRIFTLTKDTLRPEHLAPGKPASLAMNAVAALAALGDDRLPQCAQAILHCGRRWFARQVHTLLCQTCRKWPTDHGTTSRVNQVIAMLKPV